ncbi:MAG: signal peptidase II [bacterium]
MRPNLTRANRPCTGCLLLAAAVMLGDQLSKQAVYARLAEQSVEVLPFLRFALGFNRGAAFGLLSDAGGWQHYLFVGIAGAVSLALFIWLLRVPSRGALLSLGLALVLGGALGNLIDRISHRYVIDFIVLHWGGWQFPAFNLADGAITLGAAALMIDILRGDGGDARHRQR